MPGAASDAPVAAAVVTLSSGRRYEIEATPSGDRLIVRGKGGGPVLQVEITDAGPVLTFAAPDGDRAPSSRGAWEAESSVPPGRAAAAPRSAIVPLPRSAENEADEPVEVPRAMPLPSIKMPAEAEPFHLDGGSARSGVTSRRPPGETGAAPAARGTSGFAAAGPASERDPSGGRRGLPSLTLEQYAVLCAEASLGVASLFDRALLRHGIADRDLWKAVDRSWQERLEREPILTLRWMELTTRYREHLTRR
ncbi:hypothetical protein [Sorangium cellulosum]|uniref:hypothetical protein n=1 Tax=Sorangium cellulosum TaxID=56 RepID=UPI000CF4214A|nr:hypothetical protein [Sorangium cellulosum]